MKIDFEELNVMYDAPHPGDIIKRVYLEPLNLSVTELAKHINMSRRNLYYIVNEKASITPETAFKLSKVFTTSIQVWLNLQQQYDLSKYLKELIVNKIEIDIKPLH